MLLPLDSGEKKLQAWQLPEKAQSPNELKKKDALTSIATQ